LRGEQGGKLLIGKVGMRETQAPWEDEVPGHLAFLDKTVIKCEKSPDVCIGQGPVELLAEDLTSID